MKKQLLLLAGCAIMFASCGNDNKAAEDAAANQRKIDSAASAASAAKEAEIKAVNDSTIAAAAKAKADSEAIAKEAVSKDHAKHPAGSTKHTTTTPKKTETPPPPPSNPKAGRFDEKAAKETQKANSDKKADRFK